jgi:hypothetical protein
VMSVPLSAADVLGEHVLFELECIDRMYCNAYVRKLSYPGGVASFFTAHRGASFASMCLADSISKRFVSSIQRFAAEREIQIVRFEKGQRKDDVAHEHLARFDGEDGIYMIGVAQEKARGEQWNEKSRHCHRLLGWGGDVRPGRYVLGLAAG